MRKPPKLDSFKHYRMCVLADARRYERKWWKHPGFWAVFSYRTRRFRKRAPLALWLLMFPLDVLCTIIRMQTSHCQLPSTARIGPGLYLPHPDGVILSDIARVGPEVAIFQQVTIGYWLSKSPIIHGRAAIFAGAKVIGDVTVGRSAMVGANAVVTRDVPSCYVAVGVPARMRPGHSIDTDVSPSVRNPMSIDTPLDIDPAELAVARSGERRTQINGRRSGVAHQGG